METPFGEVHVTRQLYQAVGVEGIAPLDAALGLPDERYTHEVRRIVAEESAKSSFDEVVELIDKRTGASVPKRQVEELAVRSALERRQGARRTHGSLSGQVLRSQPSTVQ